MMTRPPRWRGQVRDQPLRADQEAVAEADQEEDVGDQPTSQATKPDSWSGRTPPPPVSGRWWPACPCRGSSKRLAAACRAVARGWRGRRSGPAALATGARPGTRLAVRARWPAQVADDVDVRVARDVRSGSTSRGRARSGSTPEQSRQRARRRRPRPRGPCGGDPLGAERHAVRLDRRSPRCRCAPRRPAVQMRARRAPTGRERSGQHARPGLDEDDPRPHRGRWRGSRAPRVARQLGDRAGHLDAGRAAADDHEGQQPRRARRVVARPRRPARRRAACGGGCSRASSSVFRPGARRLPLVVAEVARAATPVATIR